MINEEGLRGGLVSPNQKMVRRLVNVVTGSCKSDKPGEGVPKECIIRRSESQEGESGGSGIKKKTWSAKEVWSS